MRVTTRETGTTQLTVTANGVRLAPVTLTAEGFYDLTLSAGLHLLGLPVTPPPAAYQALLATSGVEAATFDATTQRYVTAGGSYAPGQGLWVANSAAISRRVLGTPMPNTPQRLVLRRGWNAVANPFTQALDWDLTRLSVESGGVSLGHLEDTALWARVAPYGWVFDQATGYRLLADTSLAAFASAQGSLPVGAGFWFYAAQDGLTLVLPAPAAARAGRAPSAPKAGDWSLALRAVQGDQHGTALVGVSGSLAGGLTLAKPPAARGQAGPALSLLAADGTRLAGDLRGTGQTTTWTLDLTAGATDEVVLNWPGLGRELPRGLVLELRDGVSDGLTLLNTKAAWRWQPHAAGETRRLTLTARQGHVARATVTGLDLTATRGGSAAIRLTLSAPAEVTVQVRGLGGRLVRTLTQTCEAGTTLLTWDGTDQSGRPVPAGSYRLEAQAASAVGALAKTVRTVTLG
ncbi:MAG: hypothetical protein HZB16_06585 [Armatimonadetes bacterium]|nr:hypothetical protein [Armatimonadota bacterium]